MNEYETSDAGMACELKSAQEIRKATQREQLTAKKQRLSAQLSNVNAALAALDENPQLEKFLEVMARA